MFQASVDRNFDKWELYMLRNILRVPEELSVSVVGWQDGKGGPGDRWLRGRRCCGANSTLLCAF